MIIVMTVLTGLVYPAAVTAIAKVVFPRQAHGSLVTRDGKVVGSALIGQKFSQARSTSIPGRRRRAAATTRRRRPARTAARRTRS